MHSIAMAGDPDFAEVKLLCHCDGSTTFADVSPLVGTDARVTQIALEHWASVASAPAFRNPIVFVVS